MFGYRLKEVRNDRRLTLDALADMYNQKYGGGLSKGTLSKYENEKQEPMISTATNLAEILGVSVDYLLTGEQKTPSAKAEGAAYSEFMALLPQLTEEEAKQTRDFAEYLLQKREEPQK